MGLPGELTSMPLRKLAEYIKSWDFYESTLAMAAINTYYNHRDRIKPLHPRNSDSAFDEFSKEVQGKRVAVVGHFPFLEKIAGICELSILEKSPQEGDYPDSACEYILGEQDYVFITGTTLANKTLPRLLKLSKNAKVIMTGPSIPLTSIMFDYGVHTLAGCLAAEPEKLWKAVDEGMEHQIFQNGAQMVQIES